LPVCLYENMNTPELSVVVVKSGGRNGTGSHRPGHRADDRYGRSSNVTSA